MGSVTGVAFLLDSERRYDRIDPEEKIIKINNQTTEGENMRLFRIILFSLIMLGNLSMWLLIGTGWNVFQFVVCLIIIIVEIVNDKKKRPINNPSRFIVFTLGSALIVVYFSMLVLGFGKMGIYDLKIKYADQAGYTTGHFPMSVPEGAKLEDIGMMPTIMQGDGYVHALFSADEQTVKLLESKAADSAIMSFSLDQYLNNTIPIEHQNKAQKIFDNNYHFENTAAVIRVEYSALIHEQEKRFNPSNGDTSRIKADDIAIYIIDSNFYWNHLRTNAVIVDKTSGHIEYIGQ